MPHFTYALAYNKNWRATISFITVLLYHIYRYIELATSISFITVVCTYLSLWLCLLCLIVSSLTCPALSITMGSGPPAPGDVRQVISFDEIKTRFVHSWPAMVTDIDPGRDYGYG